MGNNSEGGLPDCPEQDPEKQRLRKAQADVCQVSAPSHTNTEAVTYIFFWRHHVDVIVFFFRVDGMVKHLTESRDFDHRLRALESEVKLKYHCNTFD